MVEVGKKVIYHGEVCTVKDIISRYKNDEDYFLLASASDASLIIHAPCRSANDAMRGVMSVQQVKDLLDKLDALPMVEISTGNRGIEYKELLQEGSCESLLAIIKTGYVRKRIQPTPGHRQKISENDKTSLRQAERVLYSEIAASLDLSYNQAEEYVTERLQNLPKDT